MFIASYPQAVQRELTMTSYHAFLAIHVKSKAVFTAKASQLQLAARANVRDSASTLQS